NGPLTSAGSENSIYIDAAETVTLNGTVDATGGGLAIYAFGEATASGPTLSGQGDLRGGTILIESVGHVDFAGGMAADEIEVRIGDADFPGVGDGVFSGPIVLGPSGLFEAHS